MISNCGHDENGAYTGGTAGDQSGTEWYIREWYSKPWDCVIHYPAQKVRDTIAELAIEAANNDLIGYDQAERLTFWEHLKASGYYPKNITVACEADCSSGVAAIVKATGYLLDIPALQNVSADCYTGNLKDALWSAGFEVLTDSMYTDSDEHLRNGDILLSIGHHTCINVSDGSAYQKEEDMAITAWDLRVQCNKVCSEARTGGWKYGDSKTLPPCADKTISCDRMIARALYNLGYTNQPKGGITVLNMEKYLTSWGFSKITDANKLTHGDIVLMKANGTSSPTAAWHTFLCDQFWGVNKIYKYDCGSQARIQTSQPFANVPLNEWSNKTFYCGFRVPTGSTGGTTTTKTVTKPSGKDKALTGGIYTIKSALNTKYVLDVASGSLKNQANVQVYQANASAAQAFYIYPVGNESYIIGNVQSGKMLDVTNGCTASGTNAQQYESNGTKAQRYWIQDAGDSYCTIYSQLSGLALDVTNGQAKNCANVQFYTPNGSTAQKWKIDSL
jgi:hypothetical protein